MNRRNTINKPLSIKEKCLAACALMFTSFAFIAHSTMIIILAVLIVLSIVTIKQQKVILDKPTKLLILSFVLLFICSIPNMIMDSLYVGKLKASSLDVPSRYLLGAVALIGLSQLRVKAKHLFIGNMIGIVVAFALYPVWGSFILDVARYSHRHIYSPFLAGVLQIAYMSIPCMFTALISSLYFHKSNNKPLTILSVICANLASITMILSGSKVILLAYPLVIFIMFFTWKKTNSEMRWLILTPLFTGIAFLLGQEKLTLINAILFIPLIMVYLLHKNKQVRWIKIYNVSVFLIALIFISGAIIYSQTDSGQKLIKESTSASLLLKRLNSDVHSMDKVNSTTKRIGMWKSGWASFKESPLLGQGYEQRRVFNNQFIKDNNMTKALLIDNGKGSLHNEIINILGKKGIIGFIAILTLYFVPISLFYRLRKASEENYYVGLSGLFLVFSFIVSGLTERLLMGTVMSSFFVISICLTYFSLQPIKPIRQSEICL